MVRAATAGEKHGWRKVADEHGFILVLPQGSIAFSTEIKYTNGVPYYTSYNNWSRKATATRLTIAVHGLSLQMGKTELNMRIG